MPRTGQLLNFHHIQSLPTEYHDRRCTDVFCLIVGILYSVILIVLAIVLWDYEKFVRTNFPTDSDGKLCGIDKPTFPAVYFPNPSDLSRRVCVQDCPKQGDGALACSTTHDVGCRFNNVPGYEVIYYPNKIQNTRSGPFCMPLNEQMRRKFYQQSNLQSRQFLYNSLDTIILCFLITLGISVLYFILVQLMPKIMNYAAIAFGALTIIACAICLFLYQTKFIAIKIIIGVLLLVTLFIIVCVTLSNLNNLRIHSIFLNASTQFLRARPLSLLYIPLFCLFMVAFIAMVVLQFSSFWTTGQLYFEQTYPFYRLRGALPIILNILVAIQVIWGFSFLKSAYNFCISGQAVLWYYDRNAVFCQPLKLLLCKHLGSVIGGSFILGFFTIFSFIFDLFRPRESSNPNSSYSRCFNRLFKNNVCQLVRTDTMAFINLTGNPFCNSARYCDFLCDKSLIMDHSQSTSRVYRLCAHIFMVGVILIIALYIKGVISIYAIVLIIINTIFISSLFVSFHADAAQAIQIIMLTDQQLARRIRQQRLMKNQGSKIHPIYDASHINPPDPNRNFTEKMSNIKLRRQFVREVQAQRMKQLNINHHDTNAPRINTQLVGN